MTTAIDRPPARRPPAPATPSSGGSSIRERLVKPMPSDGWIGWAAPLAITFIAGLMRFWHLDRPRTMVFDEVYYAKNAKQLLDYGVEFDATKNTAEFIVHPPVGKWVIAVGEWLFGYNSFGWRFSVAVLGTLAVLMVARIGRRLFRSTLIGCIAALLLTFDGMAFVHSRTALLDPILMFFGLAAFGCLLIDRDRARERLAASIERHGLGPGGPRLGWRPWRLAAGVMLGLACGTKWSGLYFLAGFGLLSVCWDLSARKAAGVFRPISATIARDVVPAFLSLVGVAVAVYVLSWTGWFLSDAEHAWDRGWAATRPGPVWIPEALRSLWHYHAEMWQFHKNLRTFHPYRSNPWSWLVLGRPVAYYYVSPKPGEPGCDVAECTRAVTALGTPLVWWAAILAIFVTAYGWIGRRDWRAGAILMGIAAGYLPWFAFQERTVYSFYAVAFVPFLALAIAYCAGLILGGPGAEPRRRTIGAAVVGAYLMLVVIQFGWLYPILSAELVTHAEWARRMWFRSWILRSATYRRPAPESRDWRSALPRG